METVKVDCPICKAELSLKATKAPKFNTALRIIGYIVAAPSVFAMLMGLVTITGIIGLAAGGEEQSVINAFDKIGLIIIAFSLLGGLIGLILMKKRKIFKCLKCEFIVGST